ncbi:3-deoxy-D-manno-octulosonic acid transferase [Candidatus Desantisbacteria bacterium]|nr:3-deoxy-D-manno-octulosonic acid transferase [Candidatus Desantisbacteria bacterium]
MKKNVFIFFYNFIWFCLLILGLPVIFFFKKHRNGLFMRLGNYPLKWKEMVKGRNVIWIHAASLGEINSIKKIITELKKKYREYIFVISTLTEAGYNKAYQEYGSSNLVIYAPLDIFFIVQKSLSFFNPKILLIAETELWPEIIVEAHKKNIKICLINGRITDKSVKHYLLLKKFFNHILLSIDRFCVQSNQDKNNFLKLGADKEKIAVCGQTKFDIEIDIPIAERQMITHQLGLESSYFLLTAGSTRPGEEEILIDVFTEIKNIKTCKLILVPRHLARIPEIVRLVEQKGISYKKLSEIESQTSKDYIADIFIVDFMGKLLSYYAIADVAFVGGTLMDFGGHNLIEPALLSQPVIFGPYIINTKEAADILIESGGGKCVKDKLSLKKVLLEYMENSEKKKLDGKAAYEAVIKNKGASTRTIEEINSLL